MGDVSIYESGYRLVMSRDHAFASPRALGKTRRGIAQRSAAAVGEIGNPKRPPPLVHMAPRSPGADGPGETKGRRPHVRTGPTGSYSFFSSAPGALARNATQSSSVASGPSPRAAALAFCEGARDWDRSAFLRWVDQHLVRSGRLYRQSDELTLRVHEDGVGAATVRRESGDDRELAEVLRTARGRVQSVLSEAVTKGCSHFVHTALFGGRVRRLHGSTQSVHWEAVLREADSLSDQVLALFAAEALTHREEFEEQLSVCGECGAITFREADACQRGCSEHPYGQIHAEGSDEQREMHTAPTRPMPKVRNGG